VQDLATVGEEGREARGKVEAAGVELGQVSDQAGSCLALAPGESLDPGDQVIVRELGGDGDLHAYSIPNSRASGGQVWRIIS
jgi:hypothetical protein